MEDDTPVDDTPILLMSLVDISKTPNIPILSLETELVFTIPHVL